MKIGIVGLGIVGSANKFGFEKNGHQVLCHDLRLQTQIEDVLDTSIIFLCVPTPSKENGRCDTSIIESVIASLHEKKYSGIIAIRSTTTPGFTQKMIELYDNNNICFVPEFLRERYAVEDFINNHNLLAIGTENKKCYDLLLQVHGNLPKNIVQLSPTEAEFLKYFNNVYAALRITFANVFFEACDKMNCDYSKIKNAYIKTGKALDLYLNVSDDLRGYAGMCLPKDTKSFINLLKDLDLSFDLIESIDADNSKLKKTVYKGMRS